MSVLRRAVSLVFTLFLFLSGFTQDAGWYRHFSGAIGKYPITIHLHKTGHSYAGYYYYDKTGQPVYFTGDDTTSKRNKISLFTIGRSPDEGDETFTISVTGAVLSGDWQKNADGKSLPVTASEKNPSASLHFDLVYTTGNTLLRPAMKESPVASFEASAVWPKENSGAASYIKNMIVKEFEGKTNTQPIGQLFLANKKGFMEGYIRDNKNVADSEIAELSYSYNLEQIDRLMVVYHSEKLLTLVKWYYGYMGGAHGNHGSSYFSIDLSTNKKLILSNVLTPAGIKQLPKLLEKNFRKQYMIADNAPLTEAGLFENALHATDNFYLTSKGIGFGYLPYEIGPFSMGEINIFIPFSEITAYIVPTFKNLIK